MDIMDKKTYYVNIASVNLNNYDILFMLGNKKSRESNDIKEEDFDFGVVMSPQHAKAFSDMLSNTINQYEQIFGEIKLGPIVDNTPSKE